MFRRYFCLMVLFNVPAFVLLTVARADDEDRPPPMAPAAPVLEWRDRRVFKTETRPHSLDLSPDGKLLVACEWVEKPRPHALAHIWDTRTGKDVACFDSSDCCVRFSPDNRLIAFSHGSFGVRLFNVSERKFVRKLEDSEAPDGASGIHGFPVFSPDGKLLAAAFPYRGDVTLWDVATGKRLKRFSKITPKFADQVAFSPDGKTLAVAGEGVVRLLDVTTGKEVRRLQSVSGNFALSPDGSLLAHENGDGKIHVRDLRTGKVIRRLTWVGDQKRKELDRYREKKFGFGPDLSALAFSPDGRCLIVPCEDMWVRVWEVASGQQRYQVEEDIDRFALARASTLCAGLALAKEPVLELVVWDARPALPSVPAEARPDANKAWAGLADANAGAAYTLMRTLMAAPRQAVALLDKRLQAVPAIDAAAIARLLADLDDERFELRERASQRLAEVGEAAREALEKAKGPSAEAERRIERLRNQLDGSASGEYLRQVRAVEVLESIGTEEARAILKRVVGGEPRATLTREAKAALGRLDAK